MISKFVAVLLAVLAANPAAALAPAAAFPKYSDTAGDARGRGVAVYPNGDVLFLGHANGGPSGPVLVRMDPAMTSVKYRKPLAGFSGMLAHCIAISGDLAYVGGSDIGNTVGRVVAVNASGDAVGAHSDFGVPSGFRSIAVDPVDNSLWVVGLTGSAPTKARVVHLASGLGPLSVDDYLAPGGTDAQGRSVAVTADRVYVGGSGYDLSVAITRPWIMARTRQAPTALWHKFQTTMNNGVVSGLSAAGDDVYSFVSWDPSAGMIQGSSIFKNDPASGAFNAEKSVVVNAPMTTSNEFAGGVVRHPSLPLVIASTEKGFKVFKPDLTEIAGAAGTFIPVGLLTPAWLAVSNTLEFSVYGALSYNEAAIWRFNGVGMRMSNPFDTVETKSKLLVAPNRLDLSKPGAKIRFVVMLGDDPAAGKIRIHDLAGRPVITLSYEPTAGKTAEVLWDGRREDGSRVGPGGYLAAVDGAGFEARVDRGLFVITGAAQ